MFKVGDRVRLIHFRRVGTIVEQAQNGERNFYAVNLDGVHSHPADYDIYHASDFRLIENYNTETLTLDLPK